MRLSNHGQFRPFALLSFVAIVLLFPLLGCQQQKETNKDTTKTNSTKNDNITRIEPGLDSEERMLSALIMAKPGAVIELTEGRFDCQSTLSLQDVSGVTLRGQGPDKTILSFKNQGAGTGGEGLAVTADDFVIENLAIEDTKGDALKVSQSKGVTIRNVRTEWTEGPKETNGSYGIYPVECSDVLVEDCVAIGASDAGIYVGQSTDVVVRRNRLSQNVAGIEIENCTRADVYGNEATKNAGGILCFSLPNLPASNGSVCRIFRNNILGNNHDNFAPKGNIVALVPPGTGVMIMAYDQVEIFENTFRDNQTINLAILGYHVTQLHYVDEKYDPFCEAITIHNNTFEGGGDKPRGLLGKMLGSFVNGQFPDIAYGGIINESKTVDGQLPEELRIAIRENGDADFANLDLSNFDLLKGKTPNVTRDLTPHDIERAPLPAVQLGKRK